MRSIVIAAIAVILLPSFADAQAMQRPQRPYRGLFGGGPPPDPNRTRQELTISGSVLGGYDDWMAPGGTIDPVNTSPEHHNGNAVTGDLALAFSRGRAVRMFTADARAFTNWYSGMSIDPTVGGELRASVDGDLGRKNRVRLAQTVGYQPTYVLGTFTTLETPFDPNVAPEASVSSGVIEQRSWSSVSSGGMDRRWSPRHATSIGTAWSTRRYLDDLGNDSETRSASAAHTWNATRRIAANANYAFTKSELTNQAGSSIDTTTQDVLGGIAYSRRLSPSRQLQLSVSGGSTFVRAANPVDGSTMEYWTPAGNAALALDVGRSWNVAGQYRRATSVLPGVSLASFGTDAANVSIGGLVSRDIETAITATFANGRAGGPDSQGTFRSYSGSVQMRWAISEWLAATANYDFYAYRLNGIADAPLGLPPSYNRQAIRIGVSVWLPLYGTYVGSPRETR